MNERDALEIHERPNLNKTVLGSVTRSEYKMKYESTAPCLSNSCLRLKLRGDQQDYELVRSRRPLYSCSQGNRGTLACHRVANASHPSMIAAQHGAEIYGTDTKQAFFYGNVGHHMAEDEEV
jgi:hypothetical protein